MYLFIPSSYYYVTTYIYSYAEVGSRARVIYFTTADDESDDELSTGVAVAISVVVTFLITLVVTALITYIITSQSLYYKYCMV